MADDIIFRPLEFRNLTVKNRVFRSNVSGRFGNYNGSGGQAPHQLGGKIRSWRRGSHRLFVRTRDAEGQDSSQLRFYRQRRQEFPSGVSSPKRSTNTIVPTSFSSVTPADNRISAGLKNMDRRVLSSTSDRDPFHGILCRAMTVEQVRETVQLFADGARRAREAGIDGVELHGANGYLITQFLSSAINDRTG